MYYVVERAKQYLDIIRRSVRTDKHEITGVMYSGGKEKPEKWEKFEDLVWGGYDKWAWFKTTFKMPAEFDGKTVVLELVTGSSNDWNANNPQFLVYVNGVEKQAFDTNHTFLYLTDKASANEEFEVVYFGYSGRKKDSLMNFKPSLYIHNEKVRTFYYNLLTAVLAAEMHDRDNEYRINIENYITNALNLIDLRIPESDEYYKSIDTANTYLEEEFYKKFCGVKSPTVACIGHTHIDVAWQWTVEQTRQKAVRSFTTALELMDRYPDFIFMSSQPQLYKFVKEDAPEVYKRIKRRVAEGRWEPEGAMWLEADCNLISGESMIRQILHGKRFFKEEFGKDSKILWLPDVFGYSGAMPQILKKSGVDTFVTSKISWNEYNAMPYETFSWQGIDGTEIFTQFIMGAEPNVKLGDKNNHYSSYNAKILPVTLAFSWEHYHQKGINDELLTSYGYGDGGGGVTEEMLEFEKRTRNGIPGAPASRLSTAADSIARIKKNVEGKKLPKWVGELYLELHRGTYTSMAKNKRFNRLSEFLLQHTETVSLISKKLLGGEYPKKDIYNSWETVLLNQFHDIIPGSSIKDVYDVTDIEYRDLIEKNTKISDGVLENIADNTKSEGVLVYNPTGFLRSEPVTFNGREIFALDIPAYGWRVIEDIVPESGDVFADESHMENKFFSIDIDGNGNFTSIYDKINERELIKEGACANVLQAFDDHPRCYDNWEISIYYTEKMWEINDVENIEIINAGPLSASVKITKKFLNSRIIQIITIYRDIPRIDFDNDIDWKEHHILLKAAFPVDINANNASYEIQYGALERPTHTNTSWDAARFEVCAHKWADLSEADYGAAVLNDCKYGYDIHDGVMRLSLLKCGTEPNPEADIGRHVFKYSFMPHAGDWRRAGVVKEAYALNCPLKVFKSKGGGGLPDCFSLISSDRENVVVSSVKEACDSEDVIVRVYEAHGRRSKVKLTLGFEAEEVFESNMIETEDYKKISGGGNSFEFEIRPFEIKTFRIK